MSVPATFFRRNDSYSSIPLRTPFTDTNGSIPQHNNNNNNRQRKQSRFMSKTSSIDNPAPKQSETSVTGYLSHRYQHPNVEHDRREKITINVSGERYQTYVDTLDRFPQTLLGNSLKREEFYDDVEDEYFFDRDRTAFNAILYYYQSWGQLYCPLTVPMTILVTEANFFELGNDALKQVLDLQKEDSSLEMPKSKIKKKIWCLFEHPETSRAAHILTSFSVLMILFSVTILCVETLPVFRTQKTDMGLNRPTVPRTILPIMNVEQVLNNRTILKTNSSGNTIQVVAQSSPTCHCSCKCNIIPKFQTDSGKVLPSLKEDIERHTNWKSVFQKCEMVSVIWFTFEFLMRFFSSPNKKKFMRGFLNIIDVVSILPFYITVALNRHEGFGLENFRVIRLVRVFRIFKLSRHSKGLQILGLTLRASMRELGLMVFFLAIGVILFSSAVYYLETDNFTSIPDAFWWAIITMCTVGYGDKVPKTFWGKLVGSACSVCGVLSIALPVPVIVSNFDYFYNRERTKKMHEGMLTDSKPPEGFKTDNNDDGDDGDDKNPNHKNIEESLPSPSPSLPVFVGRPRNQSELSTKSSPSLVKQRNGSVKSATDSRNDEIHRQATIRGLERRNRKLSQKLSEASLNSPSYRKNGHIFTPPSNMVERESFM